MSAPTFIHQYAYTSVLHYLQAAEDGELRPATADEVTSIVFSVTDLQTGLAVVGFDGASVSPAAVMLSEATEAGDDSRWFKNTPFNYCHTLPDTAFPNAPRSYLYEATLGLANGRTTQVKQRFETLPIYGVNSLPTPDPGGGSEDPDPVDPVTMFIVAVSPDPRTTAVSAVSIIFSRAVTGFTIAGLSLTRDGGGNLLSGSQSLTTSDNITFSLSGLATITADEGSYALVFDPTGVTDTDANEPDAWVESWSVQADVPDPLYRFPTSDNNLRFLTGTHKSFSASFGVAASSWSMAYHGGMFVVWMEPGVDPLVKPPQTSAELRSGVSTGPGTYTLQQTWDYAANRFRASYPDMWIGLYISGGFVWAPEWLFNYTQFTSVYPQAHVLWDEAFGFDGAYTNWGITSGSAAIASVEDDGGFLKLNFASAICMPTYSRIKISGASNASYAGQICNVTSGSSSGGGGTVSSITTDLAYDGTSTGGSIQGGARKAVNWSSPLFLSYFKPAILVLVDYARSRHNFQSIWFDEQAHEQVVPSETPWATIKAPFWESVTDELHARGLASTANITLHAISKAYIMAAEDAGDGKLRLLLRDRIMLTPGQGFTIAGCSVSGYDTTHTCVSTSGRYVFTSTAFTSTGTGGTLNNDDVLTQLDSFLQSFDGFTFEGTWMQQLRTQAITEQFVENLRYLWDAGFSIGDIAQANQIELTISTSQNKGGYTEFTCTSAVTLPIGARIGVYGHTPSGLNEIHYVRDVWTSGVTTFTVETAYVGSAGTGGGLVYSNLGRVIPVDSADNTGVGGRRRITCGASHHIFPLELTGSAIKFYGTAWSSLSSSYTPVMVGSLPSSNPTIFDIADTTSISISGRGYAVDVNGQRRFWAGFLCCIREPGDRNCESQDVSAGTPPWATWPLRLGAASGAASYTYGSGQDPRCTLITRTFANGTVSVYPQEGYVVTVINGVSE